MKPYQYQVWLNGEYIYVQRHTSVPDLLLRAHHTPLTQIEANIMVYSLTEQYHMNAVAVRFTSQSGYAHTEKCRGILIMDMTLPAIPLPFTDVRLQAWGYLRVGIVLHEFAHLLLWWRDQHTPPPHKSKLHGKEFISTFDELLCHWSDSNE